MTGSEGFDRFYTETRERLIEQIFLFTGDEVESRDLVQQAFEKAWKQWGRVALLNDPEAWVRLVAFNLAKNHRRWRRLATAQQNALRPSPEPVVPEQGFMELRQALASLSPEQRRAVILHHVVGLTIREISEEMSSPPGTVMSWLHRGRANLASAIAAMNADESEEAR
jgi:RNA polymerase sigma-70 factor (ECF subfamily)